LCFNVAVVLGLIGIRVAPMLIEEWRERRGRLADERARQTKQRELKEQRELIERMREARKRQAY
jgi:hypothetical protein